MLHWLLFLIDIIWHGIIFVISPIRLFNIQRKRYGDVFPLQFGSERWTMFSRSAMSTYWKLMDNTKVTALCHRIKVPHLIFSDISVNDVQDKTSISRIAVIDIIKRNNHKVIIDNFINQYPETIRTNDLQKLCYEIISKPMMEWLLGDLSSKLTSDFYNAMDHYSMSFNPTKYFGLRLDFWTKIFPSLKGNLQYHQDRIRANFQDIYKYYYENMQHRSKELNNVQQRNNRTNVSKSDGIWNLIDYYFSGYIDGKQVNINEKDFVWLMNATLWAAIHYPWMILFVCIMFIMSHDAWTKKYNIKFYSWDELVLMEKHKRVEYISGLVKEVLRYYPAALLPKVALHDIELDDIKIQKGEIIGFSPIDCHFDNDKFPDSHIFDPYRWINNNTNNLVTGSKGHWACPAIIFSIDWITHTLVTMIEKYKSIEYDDDAVPPISYQMVLIPNTHPVSITFS